MKYFACYRQLLVATILAGCSVASQGSAAKLGTLPPDDALFTSTVASLADSIPAIGRMIGAVARGAPLRIDPRPLHVRGGSRSDMELALADMQGITLDSISDRDRLSRANAIERLGLSVGDLGTLSKCRAAEVRPPGDTAWTLPEPCSLAPAVVAGIGLESKTSRNANIRVLIVAALPFKVEYSARYTFAHESTWRLTRTSGWAIAE
jgi:hypothetical protein